MGAIRASLLVTVLVTTVLLLTCTGNVFAQTSPSIDWDIRIDHERELGMTGGAGTYYVNAMDETDDGGAVVAGYATLTGDEYNAYIVKVGPTYTVDWEKSFGTGTFCRLNSVEQTPDGGYIVSGTALAGDGSYSIYVAKLYSTGDVEWQWIDDWADESYGASVSQTADGGYIVAGTKYNPESYGYNEVCIKLDADGDCEWAKRVQYDEESEITYGEYYRTVDSLDVTSDGYVISGLVNDGGSTCVFMLKTDLECNFEWEYWYGYGEGQSTDPSIKASSIQRTSDDGFILVSTIYGYWDTDVLLVKTNASGTVEWEKSLERSYEYPTNEYAYSVEQTDDGYLITGTRDDTQGRYVYLHKTDSQGNTLWEKNMVTGCGYGVKQVSEKEYLVVGTRELEYGKTGIFLFHVAEPRLIEEWVHYYGNNFHPGYSDYNFIVSTADGGYAAACTVYGGDWDLYDGDYYLLKADANGQPLWEQTYGIDTASPELVYSSEVLYSVSQTDDGGYILAGSAWMSSGDGDEGLYLVKTFDDGTLDWDLLISEDRYYFDYGSAVQTDDGGYIISATRSAIDESQSDLSVLYIIKIDSSGELIWQKTISPDLYEPDIMSFESCYRVQQTSDGAYLISSVAWTANGRCVYLLKTDDTGDIQWDHKIDNYPFGQYITTCPTSDGGCILAGTVMVPWDGGYRYEACIFKLDNNGNLPWDKVLYDWRGRGEVYDIIQTSDGGYTLLGSGYLLKVNANADFEWDHILRVYSFDAENPDMGGDLIASADSHHCDLTGDGGLIIVGEATVDYWCSSGLYIQKFKPGEIAVADQTPPTTSHILSGTSGSNGWYISDVEVTLAASDPDGSGVEETWYSFDGVNWVCYEPFVISDEGITTLYYRSDDVAGNMEQTRTVEVKIDKTVSGMSPITVALDPLLVNTEVSVTVAYTEQNADKAIVDWGDGSPTDIIGLTATRGSLFSVMHVYTTPGVYLVKVTIVDLAGNEATMSSTNYVVVYDPDGGFVTGGGWINSPAGAYSADTALTGKATFGFVSKYQKGSNVPTGNTEFQFKAGDLNFKSTSYDWLVIAGAKAQYKGTGTINGAGTYLFILTAVDGDLLGGGKPDTFRIKIWDEGTGDIVYDNQMDALETEDPTTVLGGGSIVVHKK